MDNTYGRDISDPVPVEEDYEGIEINQSTFVLQEDHLEALQACITPHKHPYHLYIKQYRHTLKHIMVY